ncbi:cAMP-regulated phosphoprotein 21-like isoform X3 [Argonauta hians]
MKAEVTMAESIERRPPKPLQKQTEFEETEDDTSTHSPSSDQSDNTITAGPDTPGVQSSGESPKSISPDDYKPTSYADKDVQHHQKLQHPEPVQIVIKSTRYPSLQTKTKSLRRSTALCCETDEDGSPPPENYSTHTGVSNDSLPLPQPTGRNRLEEEGSQSSEAGTSLSSSRDSSVDIPYTDSTGIDLEDFIKKTLNKTPKDRKILLKLETDLIKFVKEPEHLFLKFPPMSSYDRMLVHRVAAYFGLEHNIDQTGRCVIVNKTPSTRLPEFSFQEHIQDSDTSVGKKQILKRNGSLEESPQASIEDPQLNIMRKLSRPASLGGSKEDLGSRPWSSTDSSSGYGTDSSVKSRMPVTKAGSFGGFSSSHNVKTGIYRGASLSKTDSISSGTSSCLGSPMPTIPCTPPRSSVSPHFIGGSTAAAPIQSPLQANSAGQVYLNADGTIYRHTPNQTLPASVSFSPAGPPPIFSQHQFVMDARQYPDSNGMTELSQQLGSVSLSQQQQQPQQQPQPQQQVQQPQQQQTDSLNELPGASRQILYGNSPTTNQVQSTCTQPTAAYQQGYPATHGVSGQAFRYMLPVALLSSGQQQGQNPTAVAIDNQPTAGQPGSTNVAQYHQPFITGVPSYPYQSVTAPTNTETYPNSNYAQQPTVGQVDSALAGYTTCPSSYPSYGQNSYTPQTPQYYTMAASGPQIGYNFNNTGTYRPTSPPSQAPVSTSNVPLNVGPAISIGQATGNSPTANATQLQSQYVPYHNYPHYAATQQPRAPNTQIMQFSTTQVHPSAPQTYPVMRPNMQINMPLPPTAAAAPPPPTNQSSATALAAQPMHTHTTPICIKNFTDLSRLQSKIASGSTSCGAGGEAAGSNSAPTCGNIDSALSDHPHVCNKEFANNTNVAAAAAATPATGTMLRSNTADSLRFISPSGFRPQVQPLPLNHQRTRPPNCPYNSSNFAVVANTNSSTGNKMKNKKSPRGIGKDCCTGNQPSTCNDTDARANVAGSNVLEVYDLCPKLRQGEVEKLLKDLTCQGVTLHYVPHDSTQLSNTDTSSLQVSDCKTILAIFPNALCATHVLQSIPSGRYKLRSTVSRDSIAQKSE